MDTNVNINTSETTELSVTETVTTKKVNGHILKKREDLEDDGRRDRSARYDCTQCSWKDKPYKVFAIKTCHQKQVEAKSFAKANLS